MAISNVSTIKDLSLTKTQNAMKDHSTKLIDRYIIQIMCECDQRSIGQETLTKMILTRSSIRV